MRIAIASDNQVLVTGHVGKCAGFIIYDIENGEAHWKEYRLNQFTEHMLKGQDSDHSSHGHNHGSLSSDSHKRLVEGLKDCEYLVSHGMGRRLVEDLKESNIKPIVTSELNAENAAAMLAQGILELEEELICQGHRN